MIAPTVVLAGRYRLDRRIAAGGVGDVWRGTDVSLARPVAVKLLRAEYAQDPETLARFRAEARHAGSLSHPGIARVYDYGEDEPGSPPYLVMELADGLSLAQVLANGPLTPARSLNVMAQTAAGLSAAHAAGLVHRDVKPANLLLTRSGEVKITDFGIAHAAGSAPLTRTGTLVGTPAYLAPERVAGAPGTPAADLYALGVVAYECLAGSPPFGGEPMVVAAAHRDRPLPGLPPGVPGEVAALVSELTEKVPSDRPQDAGEVARRAAALAESLAGDPAEMSLERLATAEAIASPPTGPDPAGGPGSPGLRALAAGSAPGRATTRGAQPPLRKPGGPGERVADREACEGSARATAQSRPAGTCALAPGGRVPARHGGGDAAGRAVARQRGRRAHRLGRGGVSTRPQPGRRLPPGAGSAPAGQRASARGQPPGGAPGPGPVLSAVRPSAGRQDFGDPGCRRPGVVGVMQKLTPGPAVVPAQPAVLTRCRGAVDAFRQHGGPGCEDVHRWRIACADRGEQPLGIEGSRQAVQMIGAGVIPGIIHRCLCLPSVNWSLSARAGTVCQDCAG
jgi:hypothetical protein